MTVRSTTWAIIAVGAALYLHLAFGAMRAGAAPLFGEFIYNYYFLSLLEGRFDVPVRVVTLEGHYAPSGRASVYHGLAPLLPRVLLHPFIDLRTVSPAPVLVWLAAAGGTAIYHLTFARIVERHAPTPLAARSLAVVVGLMVWFASPGILLTANPAFYHEPVNIAYLCTAAFVALGTRVVLFGARPAEVLVPLAAIAAVTVHARPHVALGLYAGVCLFAGLHLLREGWVLRPVVAALAILVAGGVLLIAVNELRFGDFLRTHSAMDGAGGRYYGPLYWGVWAPDAPWVVRALEHGKFNPGRILPHLAVYAVDFPVIRDWTDRIVEASREMFGTGRLYGLRVGFVPLWSPWLVLVGVGLWRARTGGAAGWILIAATGIGAAFVLSYMTISLRYRTELWPLLAVAAILALPAAIACLSAKRYWSLSLLLWLFLLPSGFISYYVAGVHWEGHVQRGLYSTWSRETCIEMMAAKLSETARIAELCSL